MDFAVYLLLFGFINLVSNLSTKSVNCYIFFLVKCISARINFCPLKLRILTDKSSLPFIPWSTILNKSDDCSPQHTRSLLSCTPILRTCLSHNKKQVCLLKWVKVCRALWHDGGEDGRKRAQGQSQVTVTEENHNMTLSRKRSNDTTFGSILWLKSHLLFHFASE